MNPRFEWGQLRVNWESNDEQAGHDPPRPYVWRDRDLDAAMASVVEALPCEPTLELGTAPTQAVARARRTAGKRKRLRAHLTPSRMR